MDSLGQSLIEFVMGMALASVIALGGASLMRECWNRAHCSYIAFEATHARLTGRAGHWKDVWITEDAASVNGEAQCGRSREKVRLPKLDVP